MNGSIGGDFVIRGNPQLARMDFFEPFSIVGRFIIDGNIGLTEIVRLADAIGGDLPNDQHGDTRDEERQDDPPGQTERRRRGSGQNQAGQADLGSALRLTANHP